MLSYQMIKHSIKSKDHQTLKNQNNINNVENTRAILVCFFYLYNDE